MRYPCIFYTNASGLYNKLDELKHCLSIYDKVQIVCITETHLNKDILDAELYIKGYRFFRKDRNFDIHAEESDMIEDEFPRGLS